MGRRRWAQGAPQPCRNSVATLAHKRLALCRGQPPHWDPLAGHSCGQPSPPRSLKMSAVGRPCRPLTSQVFGSPPGGSFWRRSPAEMPQQMWTGFFVYPGGGSSRSSGCGAPWLAIGASLWGGPLCARRRLALCRGQPKPDCRQCPKMGASRRQVPLAAGLLDGSEGAALGRALADGHQRANRFPLGSPG